MSPTEQRIAIASAVGLVTGESLGYTHAQAAEFYRPDPGGTYHDIATFSKKHVWVQNFDPLNDLNAMHEAEKVLSRHQNREYLKALHWIVPEADLTASGSVFDEECKDFQYLLPVVRATAAQRAKAFLKTLNLQHPPPRAAHADGKTKG